MRKAVCGVNAAAVAAIYLEVDSLGALTRGVLGQPTRQEEEDSSLGFLAADGGPPVRAR